MPRCCKLLPVVFAPDGQCVCRCDLVRRGGLLKSCRWPTPASAGCKSAAQLRQKWFSQTSMGCTARCTRWRRGWRAAGAVAVLCLALLALSLATNVAGASRRVLERWAATIDTAPGLVSTSRSKPWRPPYAFLRRRQFGRRPGRQASAAGQSPLTGQRPMHQ